MPRKTQKAKLVLSQEQEAELRKTVQSRKAPIREVQQANILLRYSEGMPITEIEKMTHVSRPLTPI